MSTVAHEEKKPAVRLINRSVINVRPKSLLTPHHRHGKPIQSPFLTIIPKQTRHSLFHFMSRQYWISQLHKSRKPNFLYAQMCVWQFESTMEKLSANNTLTRCGLAIILE
jgi:hypothetical protein